MIPVPLSSLGLIFLGGGLGAMCRFLTGHWVNKAVPGPGFPWGTMAANVIGSFLIGAMMMLTIEHLGESRTRLLAITGFLGGYTTFSAFSFEVSEMLIDKRWGAAGLYAGGSVALCVAATFAGLFAVVGILRLAGGR